MIKAGSLDASNISGLILIMNVLVFTLIIRYAKYMSEFKNIVSLRDENSLNLYEYIIAKWGFEAVIFLSVLLLIPVILAVGVDQAAEQCGKPDARVYLSICADRQLYRVLAIIISLAYTAWLIWAMLSFVRLSNLISKRVKQIERISPIRQQRRTIRARVIK